MGALTVGARSDATQITSGGGSKLRPVVSADGSQVVFSDGCDSTPPGVVRDLFEVRADGQHLIQLTHSFTGTVCSDPTLSPDGQKVAYTISSSRRTDIHVMNLDGTGDVNISHAPLNNGYWSPQWMPDGQSVLCQSIASNGHLQLYRISADGSQKSMLTGPGMGDSHEPCPTPDGQRIVFLSNKSGDHDEIYSIRADGTDVQSHSPGLAVIDGPCVSTGGQVAFMTQDPGGRMHLETVGLAPGSSPLEIAQAPALLSPAWSPDGRSLVYVTADASGTSQLMETSATGQGTHPLMPGSGSYAYPAFAPDGSSLFYVLNTPVDSQIYRLPLPA